MYEQIARNKRRTIAYVLAFVAVWLGVGALLGWLVSATGAAPASADSAGNDLAPADIVTGLGIAAVLALLSVIFTLVSGTRLVLRVAGARPADRSQYPGLYDLVEALATGDGLPMPALYIVDDPSPNAFATGISPHHAAVSVTTGLLQVMDREELEGVLGHELSHIKNYDTRLLLIVSTLIGLAGLLAGLLWRSAYFVRGRGRNAGQITILVLAAGLLLSLVSFLVGPIIRLALSRRRESLADASSVELTRNPVGLLRALRTLQANEVPLARANHGTAAMYIDDPLHRHQAAWHRLYDTHPPIAERIAVLERMVQGLSV